MNPVVSVIVPVYNTKKYLDECVASILGQTWQDFEIILVDDGSNDGCSEMCDEFTALDSRVKVVHKSNGGLSSARNAGLDVARGAYVSFIDSDDRAAKEMLAELLRTANETNADIVACSLVRFDESGVIGEISPPNRDTVTAYSGDRFHGVVASLMGKEHFSRQWRNRYVCNKLFRREIIGKTRFKAIDLCEDAAFLFEIYRRVKHYVEFPEGLYLYRKTGTSITENGGGRLWQASVVLAKIFNEYGKIYYPWSDERWVANMLTRSMLDAVVFETSCGSFRASEKKIGDIFLSYLGVVNRISVLLPSSAVGKSLYFLARSKQVKLVALVCWAIRLKRRCSRC